VRIEEDGDDLRVTFEWRGEGGRVALAGGPAGWRFAENLLAREADGVWRRTYVLPRAIRATYGFLPDPPDELDVVRVWSAIRPDPLNPATFTFPGDAEDPGFEQDAVRSVVEGPDAPPNAYAAERPGSARGTVRMERFGGNRRVWLYVPPGHDAAAAPCGLLLVFDGWAYLNLVPVPTILDNLHAEGALPRLVAVLVDSPERIREFNYDDGFVRFLVDEVLPWARREGNATGDPRRTIAAGSSAGGVAAAFLAYRRPDVVANVLSQSGAFWWGRDGEEGHEWLTARIAAAPPPREVRFSLEVGLLENETPVTVPGAPTMLHANRRLRGVLGDRVVRYVEFAGGHDYLCWQATFADGLTALA
jgi:enterochelin esterase family protein